jgi:dihydrofolate reductase
LALAEIGLIDEFEFIVHPRVVGREPKLFEGLTQHLDLELIDFSKFESGAVAMKYKPKTATRGG